MRSSWRIGTAPRRKLQPVDADAVVLEQENANRGLSGCLYIPTGAARRCLGAAPDRHRQNDRQNKAEEGHNASATPKDLVGHVQSPANQDC
jgi:hypothetical protein